jgi:hypothetical protein
MCTRAEATATCTTEQWPRHRHYINVHIACVEGDGSGRCTEIKRVDVRPIEGQQRRMASWPGRWITPALMAFRSPLAVRVCADVQNNWGVDWRTGARDVPEGDRVHVCHAGAGGGPQPPPGACVLLVFTGVRTREPVHLCPNVRRCPPCGHLCPPEGEGL